MRNIFCILATFSFVALATSEKLTDNQKDLTDTNRSNTTASFQLGYASRAFSSQNTVLCSKNASGEGVFIFGDDQTGSSLSLRLRVSTPPNTNRWLSTRINGENITVALGGAPAKDNFQMAGLTEQNCSVITNEYQGIFKGSFHCYRLTNQEGTGRMARGSFSCKIETEQKWDW